MDTPQQRQSEVASQQHLQTQEGWYKLYMQPVLRFSVALLVLFLLLLAPSGDWGWQAAWLTLLAPIPLAVVPGLYYIQRHHPDLIHERQRFLRNQGTAWFEKYIVPPLLALILVKLFTNISQQVCNTGSSFTPTPLPAHLSHPHLPTKLQLLAWSYRISCRHGHIASTSTSAQL